MRLLFLIITIGAFSKLCCQHAGTDFRYLQWKSKEALVYHLGFTTTVKTKFGLFGSSTRDTSFTGSLTGTIRIICSEKTDSSFFFYGAFDSISQLQFPLPVKEQKRLLADLHKGFYFSQKESGVIDSIWLPQSVSDAGEYIIAQLLEYYQYVLPERY